MEIKFGDRNFVLIFFAVVSLLLSTCGVPSDSRTNLLGHGRNQRDAKNEYVRISRVLYSSSATAERVRASDCFSSQVRNCSAAVPIMFDVRVSPFSGFSLEDEEDEEAVPTGDRNEKRPPVRLFFLSPFRGLEVVGFALLVFFIFLVVNEKPHRFPITSSSPARSRSQKGTIEVIGGDAVKLHYKDLRSATNNFSDENKIQGGPNNFFHLGVLKNGKTVAVKKLAIARDRWRKVKATFESEVKLLTGVRHRNLVRLLGCCSSRVPEILLVYEFTADKTLDRFLFGDGRRTTLNWKQRLDVIVGIARGLAYLHDEYFHVCLPHRDISSSKIYLDDAFRPQIADLGFARLHDLANQSYITGAESPAGTAGGYPAGEWARSEKIDIYSFSVVVLEIVTGRKCFEIKLGPDTKHLLDWVWELYETDSLMKCVDEKLDGKEHREDETKKVIEIALLCTQSSVASRPSMSDVVAMLPSRGGTVPRAPTRPTVIDVPDGARGDTSSTSMGSSSAAIHTGLSLSFSYSSCCRNL